MNFSTIEKALEFYRAGGIVIASGALPEASERIGRDDPKLDAIVKAIFGVTAKNIKAGVKASVQSNGAGGIAAFAASNDEAYALINKYLARDFTPSAPCQVLHRKIGMRDVYVVHGAAKNSQCLFRAIGKGELWDPWTGENAPIYAVSATSEGTRVRMPLEPYELSVIVFSPGVPEYAVEKSDLDEITLVEEKGGHMMVKGYASKAGRNSPSLRHGDKHIHLDGVASGKSCAHRNDGIMGISSLFQPWTIAGAIFGLPRSRG